MLARLTEEAGMLRLSLPKAHGTFPSLVLKPGQVFRHDLRVRKLLNRGGMGEVYLATREGISGFKRDVALKVILPTLGEQDGVALFLSEARIAAKLEHRNIVSAHACGQEDGLLWIEQSYVRGLNMRQLLKTSGRLPVHLAAFVASEVLSGLDYAYSRPGADGQPLGVVHRDIKPSNVLVSYEGEVKLTDFGIAKALGETHATRSGVVRGTAGYIAPELFDGSEATTRSDIFCVGLLLWETLFGKALFDGPNDRVRFQKTLACVIPPIPSEIPLDLEIVLRRLLGRVPEDRYATPAEALDALQPIVRGTTAADLRSFLAQVAPMPVDEAQAAGGGDGVPVEIHDAELVSLRDVALAEAPTTSPTKTMAGEVVESNAGARRRFVSRRVKLGIAVAVTLAAGAALALSATSSKGGSPVHAADRLIAPTAVTTTLAVPVIPAVIPAVHASHPPDADPHEAVAVPDAGTLPIQSAAPVAPVEKKRTHKRRSPNQEPKATPSTLKEDYLAPPPKDD
jgi:eukaryotic-like serine/threonine-protein kinase